MDLTDEARRVYAHLKQLEAIPREHVKTEDAGNYNRLVQRLIALGYRAEEFLIPGDEFSLVGPRIRGEVRNGTLHVRYGVMHQKLGALLLYTRLVDDATIVEFHLPRET